MTLSYNTIVKYCFIGLVFIIFGNLNGITNMFFGVTRILSPLLLVFSVTIILIEGRKKFATYHISTWFLLSFLLFYIFFGVISRKLNTDYDYYHPLWFLVVSYVNTVVIFFAFYLSIVNFLRRGVLSKCVNIIYFSLIPSLLLIVVGQDIGLGNALDLADENRSSGVFRNPNDAGLQANLGLVFTLFFMLIAKRKKALGLMLIPFCIYASFLTFSRMALITSILILLFFVFYSVFNFNKIGKEVRRLYFISILLIGVGSIYIYNNFEKLLEGFNLPQIERIFQIFQIFEGRINKKTTSERSGLFEEGIDMILKHPIWGNGLGAGQGMPIAGKGVHNTYLLIGIDVGFIGLILFFFFLLSALWGGYTTKEISYSFLILGSIFVLLLFMFASHNGLETRVVNAMFGVVCGLLVLPKKKLLNLNYR